MDNFPSLKMAAAKIASSYGKRLADQKLWDALMRTPYGQRLLALSRTQKYGAEAVFYILDVIAWHKIGSDSPLRVAISEFVGDAAPEIAKRMLNGKDHTPARRKTGLDAVTDMDELSADKLLTWYRQAGEPDRRTFAHHCRKWTVDDLDKFVRLTDENKSTMLALAGPSIQPFKTAATFINEVTRLFSLV